MNILQLAPLTTEDLPAIVDLDQHCFGGLWTQDGYQRELDSPASDLIGLWGQPARPALSQVSSPLTTNFEPTPLLGIGCLWAILEEAHITILAVHPHYRRQGLGRFLLGALLSRAQRRGLEWATLEVRPSNLAARHLYQSVGFTEVGRRRHYYQDSGEDAIILWRQGLQTPEFQQQFQGWHQQSCDRLRQAGWQLTSDGNTSGCCGDQPPSGSTPFGDK
ncbi:MAG: ribosomal protein S18-alanine N-acetyltransferase [Synechococcales bacterium]|nr:ribosomal protein S18-alanine N-acetyltransferase [Synechococcales bacterium]